jgi:hypothetical protein
VATRFSLTFDSFNASLVMVADERIIDDIEEVCISRPKAGGAYECSIVRRGEGESVRLVASSTLQGKDVIQRAVGHESTAAPGFVEMTASAEKRKVEEDIADYFGCE